MSRGQASTENELIPEPSGVLILKGHRDFNYSDGRASESYLTKVLTSSSDLSTTSVELEAKIKDWPSEYHLSPKRAQLLSGFDYNRNLRVLEVGCGCGAITRFLGEAFDDVISVEGSIHRARIARQRTKDLDHVSIICAPFQELNFTHHFDVIFCIGVLEYSTFFIEGDDPYEQVIERFCQLLSKDGSAVIAIENQFGLKYFNGACEDHVGRRYEGLEGYPTYGHKVRTFGRRELQSRLKRHFARVEFFYPYPDYKIPDCVVNHEFLSDGRAGELIAGIRSRDYRSNTKPSWDEALVTMELSKNGLLPELSNSLLVLASKSDLNGISFAKLGIYFSLDRDKKFRTQTVIREASNGKIVSTKNRITPNKGSAGKLSHVEVESEWRDGCSLQTAIYARCRLSSESLQDVFSPVRPWIAFLESSATSGAGGPVLAGDLVDAIWSNIYVDGDDCHFIDQEWVWRDNIGLNTLVIRAIYTFLARSRGAKNVHPDLHVRSGQKLIARIAENVGIKLTKSDFADFVVLEAEFGLLSSGIDVWKTKLELNWFLLDRSSLLFVRGVKTAAGSLFGKVIARARMLKN